MVAIVINILDLLGTAAFAISGTIVGVRKRLDIFGVLVLSVATALGGGLIRDIIINDGFPVFFTQKKYIITSLIAAVIGMFIFRLLVNKTAKLIFNIVDAIGLGVFTSLAANKAMLHHLPFVGVVFLSVLSGVGGGVVRDILTAETPEILKREIYAIASIIGAIFFFFLYGKMDITLLMYLCTIIVIFIRTFCMAFKINLPIVRHVIIKRK